MGGGALAPKRFAPYFSCIEQADSITIDPHKMAFLTRMIAGAIKL